jgi:hypothetical protein
MALADLGFGVYNVRPDVSPRRRCESKTLPPECLLVANSPADRGSRDLASAYSSSMPSHERPYPARSDRSSGQPRNTGATSSQISRPRLVRVIHRVTYLWMVSEGMFSLALFDVMTRFGFQRVHAFTRGRAVAERTPAGDVAERACAAAEEACIWYWKRVYCLQRSTVLTWMLRRRGVRGELIIGYRPIPVDSHAWVEVAGVVLNDRPQYQRAYRVLDRL